MATADGLAKAYDPDEPRDDHGRWTVWGGIQTAQADTGTMSDATPAPRPASKKLPPRSLTLSDIGRKFLQAQEGSGSDVYSDQGGKPTIGYGHLLRPGESFPNGVSPEDAQRLMTQDIADAEKAVRRYVKVDLTQAQFDALVSFTYNEGPKGLAVQFGEDKPELVFYARHDGPGRQDAIHWIEEGVTTNIAYNSSRDVFVMNEMGWGYPSTTYYRRCRK